VDIDLLDFIDVNVGQEVDTVVFMAIAIVAALLLVVTFVMGEAFEFFGDALDIDDGGGVFNMQSIAAFLAGFGSIAWLLSGYFEVPSLIAAAGGVAAGLPMAGVVVLMTRAFMRQSVSSGFNLTDLVGEDVLVSLTIPEQGVGRVQFARSGGTHTASARSAAKVRIQQGTVVTIESVVAGEVVVRATS